MNPFLSKEGEIAYSVRGKGELHFLLVHNSGGSREMMAHTAAHFSKRGKVVTPDLLGHGSSEAPQTAYTVQLFAKSLLALCQHEKMERVVLIGLNYGATIGIEMAKMSPQSFSHLILIEPPFFMEPWIVKVVEQQIQDLSDPRKEWAQELVDAVLVQAPAPERDTALRALQKTPPFVKASTFTHLLEWDREHTFRCALPTLLVQTSQPFCTEERARSIFSDLHVGRVVGSGPWATLEVPLQLHAMIDRFLELS